MEYQFFKKYVLRSPLLPTDVVFKLLDKKIISDEEVIRLIDNKLVMEALYLASPSLFNEIEKWQEGHISNPKYANKLKLSILKYLIRMSSRCTPFGLFAGVSLGNFAKSTNIWLCAPENNLRSTRLDMGIAITLAQKLSQDKTIRGQLLFFPNSSIYRVGQQIRYIEYSYEEGNRTHDINEVTSGKYLNAVLKIAAKGCTLSNIARELVKINVSLDKAIAFTEQLVENQILISELEPPVCGPEFHEHIQAILQNLSDSSRMLSSWKEILLMLDELDSNFGNRKKAYAQIIRQLKLFQINHKEQYFFQTDMLQNTHANTLDSKWLPKIRKVLILFNKITLPYRKDKLQIFQNEFEKRYEYREMSLPKVMDVEMGLGFERDRSHGDINYFLQDLSIPEKKEINTDKPWNVFHELLNRKIQECLNNSEYTIKLITKDFDEFQLNWNDLPDTISGTIEINKENGSEKLFVSGFGGSSAVNLLGRFCFLNQEIHEFVKEIVSKEKGMNANNIIAEIVHMPQDRVGNVLIRPSFRSFEIPFLSNSTLPKQNQIDIEDLFLSIDSKSRLRLKSKRLNKEVLTRLGNAHNYSLGQLPLYQFLAHFQTEGKRNWVGFNWGPLKKLFNFLPRVEFEGIIISKAMWQIERKDIQPLIECYDKIDELFLLTKEFMLKRKIPKYVCLIEGDNSLLIHTTNMTCLQMLLDQIKGKKSFILEEFLGKEKGPVFSNEGSYCNQFVVSLYNARKTVVK
ncbi:lantibiotic dehydratase family protein [Maribacter sp. 2307UL18-2]|uniref:lantibiotic dehydratase family protein n=1 Tax=Maribacter sp. 2307UL18-2 TaxID=3386274 RepID=UPI0039BC422D